MIWKPLTTLYQIIQQCIKCSGKMFTWWCIMQVANHYHAFIHISQMSDVPVQVKSECGCTIGRRCINHCNQTVWISWNVMSSLALWIWIYFENDNLNLFLTVLIYKLTCLEHIWFMEILLSNSRISIKFYVHDRFLARTYLLCISNMIFHMPNQKMTIIMIQQNVYLSVKYVCIDILVDTIWKLSYNILSK